MVFAKTKQNKKFQNNLSKQFFFVFYFKNYF